MLPTRKPVASLEARAVWRWFIRFSKSQIFGFISLKNWIAERFLVNPVGSYDPVWVSKPCFQAMDKHIFATIISFAIYGCLFLFIGFLLFGWLCRWVHFVLGPNWSAVGLSNSDSDLTPNRFGSIGSLSKPELYVFSLSSYHGIHWIRWDILKSTHLMWQFASILT